MKKVKVKEKWDMTPEELETAAQAEQQEEEEEEGEEAPLPTCDIEMTEELDRLGRTYFSLCLFSLSSHHFDFVQVY